MDNERVIELVRSVRKAGGLVVVFADPLTEVRGGSILTGDADLVVDTRNGRTRVLKNREGMTDGV